MSLSADAEEDGAVFDVDDTREEEEMAEGGEGLGKKAKKWFGTCISFIWFMGIFISF